MFIDANIFIGAFTKTSRNSQKCETLLHRISRGEQVASTSPMVLDETIYILLEITSRELALKAYRKILSLPNLKVLPVDKKCCEVVDKFVMEGLDPQDAFHAAVMKVNEIKTICSFDKHFDKIESIKRQEPK